MIYVGLDLHKCYVTACALDALGQGSPRSGDCRRILPWCCSGWDA